MHNDPIGPLKHPGGMPPNYSAQPVMRLIITAQGLNAACGLETSQNSKTPQDS